MGRHSSNSRAKGVTRLPLGHLISSLVEGSLASSTRLAYRAAFKHYRSFHVGFYKTEPKKKISNSKLASYVAFCHATGMKYSSICSRVSALNYINKLQGAKTSGHSFLLKRVLLGCKHYSPLADKRQPITKPILKRLISVLPTMFESNYNVILISAMFTLAFFALLRVGEMSISKTANHTISLDDITIKLKEEKPFLISLSLRHYKHSVSPFNLILKLQKNKLICPVRALHAFAGLRAKKPGPFFLNESGTPVTTKQFSCILRKCISKIGLDSKLFTSHSFRIGGATLAHRKNFSDSRIRKLGRWRSNAFQAYLRPFSAQF